MEPYYPNGPRVPLLTAVMEAVIKNPSIQTVESSIHYLPLDLVTKLLTVNPTLRRLHVNLHVDDTIHGNVDAAVQALGSHPALQDINLSTSRDVPLAPFLQALQSHSNVTRLHIACPSPLSVYWQDISLVPSVLESSRQLKEVSLGSCKLDRPLWTSLTTALMANPSIDTLRLIGCEIYTPLLRDIMSNSDATQQHIRTLRLIGCDLRSTVRPRSLAVACLVRMLCGSLLRHVVLTSSTLQDDSLREFFAELSSNSASLAALHTLELLGVNHRALRHVGTFLPTTVHLRRLKIHINGGPHLADYYIPVPTSLLSGLRHNGSLHSLEIRNGEYATAMTPTARVVRIIDAYTTRNRDLPDLLQTSFRTKRSNALLPPGSDSGNDDDGQDEAAPKTARPSNGSRFPVLCQCATQAPNMTPNHMLKGLLASWQTSLGHDTHPDKKRRAATEGSS